MNFSAPPPSRDTGPPTRVVRPVRRASLRAAGTLCVVAVLLTGCRDSPTDPLHGLVAGETDLAALALELPLPAPVLESPGEHGEALVDRWTGSWERPVLEGRRLRSALYPELGDLMARERTSQALSEELGLLGAGVRRAQELDPAVLPDFLTAGIERSRTSYERGERAAAAGNEAMGWAELLRGADALREVGPEAVARSAVARVESRLGRISGDHPYSEKEWERIRHLTRGSRQALDDADWGLAIRRAFYARGLLDGNG